MYKRLFTSKYFLVGFCLISFLVFVALCAPMITTYLPDAIDPGSLLSAPSASHWMGTDQLGRDIYSRMVYGARISLSVGIIVIFISTVIGIFLGAIAGYYGGLIDYCLMRFTDIMLCFPVFFLILAVIAVLEPSVINIIVVLGLTSWMLQARLMRAEVLTLKNREFILAAKAYGAKDKTIILKHLLPNAIGPVLVSAILGVASAILAESSLSFLGLGVQPPTPSWGNILGEAKEVLGVAWWMSFYPGFAILAAILGFNLMGEGVQEYLSQKS